MCVQVNIQFLYIVTDAQFLTIVILVHSLVLYVVILLQVSSDVLQLPICNCIFQFSAPNNILLYENHQLAKRNDGLLVSVFLNQKLIVKLVQGFKLCGNSILACWLLPIKYAQSEEYEVTLYQVPLLEFQL